MRKKIKAAPLSHWERVAAEQTGEGLVLNASSARPSSVMLRMTPSPSGRRGVVAPAQPFDPAPLAPAQGEGGRYSPHGEPWRDSAACRTTPPVSLREKDESLGVAP
jgi:hypothetical protein